MTATFSPPREAPETGGRRRRRWGRWVLAVAVLLVGTAAVVVHTPWLSLREIEVLGAEHSDPGVRIAAAGIGEGKLMVWLRPGVVEEAVAGDPWVSDVRAELVLPDRLVVEVLEHTPAVWIEGTTTWMLVSRSGSVLETAAGPDDTLLRAALAFRDFAPGTVPDDAAWLEVVGLAVSLDPALAASSDLTSVEGTLWIDAGGVDARLGAAVGLADKGRVLGSMLEAGVPDGWTVDLVAPMRPALVPQSRVAAALGSREGRSRQEAEDLVQDSPPEGG
jgi:hypothetical protein